MSVMQAYADIKLPCETYYYQTLNQLYCFIDISTISLISHETLVFYSINSLIVKGLEIVHMILHFSDAYVLTPSPFLSDCSEWVVRVFPF